MFPLRDRRASRLAAITVGLCYTLSYTLASAADGVGPDVLHRVPLPTGVEVEASELDRNEPGHATGRHTHAFIAHEWLRIREYEEAARDDRPAAPHLVQWDDGTDHRTHHPKQGQGEFNTSRIPHEPMIGFEPTLSPVGVMRYMVEHVLREKREEVRIEHSGDEVLVRASGDAEMRRPDVELALDKGDFTIRRISIYGSAPGSDPEAPGLVFTYDDWRPLDDDPEGESGYLHPRVIEMHNIERDRLVRRNRIDSVVRIPDGMKAEDFDFPERTRIHDRVENLIYMPDGRVIDPPRPGEHMPRRVWTEDGEEEAVEDHFATESSPRWGLGSTWPLAAVGAALIVGALVYRVKRG